MWWADKEGNLVDMSKSSDGHVWNTFKMLVRAERRVRKRNKKGMDYSKKTHEDLVSDVKMIKKEVNKRRLGECLKKLRKAFLRK